MGKRFGVADEILLEKEPDNAVLRGREAH